MSHHELSFGIKFDSKIEGKKMGIFGMGHWHCSFLISQIHRRFGSIHRLSFGFIIAYWQG